MASFAEGFNSVFQPVAKAAMAKKLSDRRKELTGAATTDKESQVLGPDMPDDDDLPEGSGKFTPAEVARGYRVLK